MAPAYAHQVPARAVAMQTFLNWCVPRYLTASPMAGLKTPTKPNKRERGSHLDGSRSMERRKARCTQIARLCFSAAMRRSEAHALQPFWVRRRSYDRRSGH